MDGNVLIYIHKERELDDVERRYPADHDVLVDDKLRILAAVKRLWGARVTTVFPRQGHYARDPKALATYPPADVSIARIGELLDHDLAALRAGGTPEGRRTMAPRKGGALKWIGYQYDDRADDRHDKATRIPPRHEELGADADDQTEHVLRRPRRPNAFRCLTETAA